MARQTRRNSDDAKSTFSTVGEYADDVTDVSAMPSANTQTVRKTGPVSASAFNRPLPTRAPVEVDAYSSEILDDRLTGDLTALAQRRASIKRAVDEAAPSDRPMLDHLFGHNLPGR